MQIETPDITWPFLSGGGEMGAIIRSKDWSETSLGDPAEWPQSLRTTLGIMLASKFPMFLWWGPGLIQFYNDAYRPSLGNNGKHPSAVGQKAEDCWQEIWPIIKPLIDQVLNTGEGTWSEDQLIPIYRNGRLEDVYWTFSYSPVKDESGKINGVLVVCTETTDKVNKLEKINEATQQMKEVADRLRIATEATQLATWDLNLVTNEIIYSPRLAVIFGYDESKILTHPQLREILHPDDREPKAFKAFDNAMQTGMLDYEVRIVHPDKTIHWVKTLGQVVFDEAHKPVRMLGTVMDITEQKRTEQIIKKSEKKFRTLAESMPQQAWTADPEGNLNYFNQAVYEYSGLTYHEIKKDGWIQIVHPEDREENIKKWAHSVATGEPFILEHRFRRHDGEYRWQLTRALPQKDNEGNIQMWVGTSTDIQDQKMFAKELENKIQQRTGELKQSNDDLVKLNNELAQFAYVASHDLQEPLRKIQTFASRILDIENDNLSDKGKDYFARMQSASKRMQRLILDLLAYSHANTAEQHFEFVDLNSLFESVKEQLKENIEQKHAVVESTRLPALNVIAYQFEQLLTNLISNALKFSKAGRTPVITISASVIEGSKIDSPAADKSISYHHLTIADNGIGFDPQFTERIFQVFQRLHNKDEYEGTGIGLAICKKIVENHNGIITATGELNKGAVFNIYLPVENK